MISIITLAVVFILIAIRQIGRFRFQIWQVMLAGAFVVLVTGQISPSNALKAINIDVIIFLFGMFIVGQALEESGYLSHLSIRFFGKSNSGDALLLLIFLGVGFLSAILMNDTMAIIGTPVMLQIAGKTGIKPKILLLTLAFSITIGSVMSPIGNPQNLLVAVNGNIANPFVTFIRFLAIPTVINLLLAYLLIKLFYHKAINIQPMSVSADPIKDNKLATLSRISLFIIMAMILLKIIVVLAGLNIDIRLTYIALAAALPILLFSPRRFRIAMNIDWFTLVFFAAMFVLMESVWDSGFFQSVINKMHMNLLSIAIILTVSILLSQFISNVPLVTLYLPVLTNLGASMKELMALAAGSTIAGNLSILGAASNVIIIQNAEKKAGETLTLWEFVKVGIPVTIINTFVYWLYFYIIS
jgi:Na+/H+ antiporter NhaD/arsenite permease-like protein